MTTRNAKLPGLKEGLYTAGEHKWYVLPIIHSVFSSSTIVGKSTRRMTITCAAGIDALLVTKPNLVGSRCWVFPGI